MQEHVRNGMIPIAILPLDIRERLGLTLPSQEREEALHVAPAVPAVPAGQMTWFTFWPFAIRVVRKMEEEEGLPKQKQSALMNFAAHLPKPYDRVTEAQIQEAYHHRLPIERKAEA